MFELGSFSRRMALVGVVAGVLATGLAGQDSPKRGRKYKAPPATANVVVKVIRATNGKPIENASVIFHPLQEGRNAGNMELKTDDEGKAKIELLTIGSDVRMQIIAPGFQTYGEDYKINRAEMALEIRMKRPGGQYSIYKSGEGKKPEEGQPDGAQTDSTKPDASKPGDAAPDAGKPVKNSDGSKPDAVKPDAIKPDANLPSESKPEAPKDESPKDATPNPAPNTAPSR